MANHDSNKYSLAQGDQTPLNQDEAMSLKQLETCIDAELLEMTLAEIMDLEPSKRSAAIADFAEIDPLLGDRLSLAVAFALS